MFPSKATIDIYKLHCLALSPLVSVDPQQALSEVRDAVSVTEEKQFLNFVLQQGLGPLWHTILTQNNGVSFDPFFTDSIKDSILLATAKYLRQKYSLNKIEAAFTEDSIPHAVFKGAHIRELIYSLPAVRTACDIDILVAGKDKVRAIKSLTAAGMTFHPLAANISHEATLADGNAFIDLHWNILRPGRTRIDLTDEFLANKKKFSDHWGLGHEATLFIMLVHPVFAKYGTAPEASLVRLVDLIHWIQKCEINWEQLHEWLKKGGVQTAAWITTEWLEMITGVTLPESFTNSIKPSAARSLYLHKWLSNNLSTRLLNYPLLIKAGFTLPAHDRFSDAYRAIFTMLREKQSAAGKTNELEAICAA